jgi:hypothetical protein
VPSTVTWINPGGGDWSMGSNWSGGITPGASDDVIINQPGNIVVTHSQNVTDTVHSLTNSDTLDLSAGNLITGNIQNTGTVKVASGRQLAANGYVQTAGTTQLNGGTLGSLLPPEAQPGRFSAAATFRCPVPPA